MDNTNQNENTAWAIWWASLEPDTTLASLDDCHTFVETGVAYRLANGDVTTPLDYAEGGEWTCEKVGVYWDRIGQANDPRYNIVGEL